MVLPGLLALQTQGPIPDPMPQVLWMEEVVTWLWLAPCLIAAVVGAYVLGYRRGSRPVREERRQQEIAALLMGEDPKNLPATEERAVIHRPVIESSHSWSEGNNEEF